MKREISTTHETALHVVAPLRFSSKCTRVLDLGCGNGVFLQAVGEVLKTQYPHQFFSPDALAAALTGVEFNPDVAADAKMRLTSCFGKPAIGWDIKISDALELNEGEKYDFVVGNPPWIRLHDLDATTRSKLRSRFITAKGAFDLCYLFIEKALRMLDQGGELALVVPRGIQSQPAAGPLRTLLADTGKWSITPLHGSCFEQSADVAPGILRYRKIDNKRSDDAPSIRFPIFGDIAVITTGVATGANPIFLVGKDAAKKWRLERRRLRPVVRGRNIRFGIHDIQYTSEQLIWPYVNIHGFQQLDDLSSSPHVLEYLKAHQAELTYRPRLADFIRRNPSDWYRFIDPGRQGNFCRRMRIVMPVVFREPAFALVRMRQTAVLNSCLEIYPKPNYEHKVLATLNSDNFWRTLRETSRLLNRDYRRTSVTELQTTPLTNPLL
jgi:SAM-dependent methyltransferase